MTTAPMIRPPRSLLPRVLPRRQLLGGGAAVMVLALSGCEHPPRFLVEDIVRRLARRSVEAAMAQLAAPGGWWDQWIARLDLPGWLGPQGAVLQFTLTSPAVHRRLVEALRPLALRAAQRAVPIITNEIEAIGTTRALEILHGGPRAITAYLRARIAGGLIGALEPTFDQALRLIDDPAWGPLLAALTGLDLAPLIHGLAATLDTWLWDLIGAAEEAIRKDPRAGGDPVLEAALRSGI